MTTDTKEKINQKLERIKAAADIIGATDLNRALDENTLGYMGDIIRDYANQIGELVFSREQGDE